MAGSSKDQRLRAKKDAFKDESFAMISEITGESIREVKGWNKKIELATKARKQLKSIIRENTNSNLHVGNAESAFRELFKESSSTVPKQECVDEIYDPLGFIGVLRTEALQEAKEESQSFGEEIKQIMGILEQRHQSMQEAMACTVVGNMLQKIVNSCLNVAQIGILSQDCADKVQETHGVGSVTLEIEGEQLKLNFSPALDSEVPIEMTVQEEQGKEVVLLLTIRSVAGRLAELAMKITNQDMLNLPPGSWDFDSLTKYLFGDEKGEGTGTNAVANEVNMKLAPDPDETCIVHGYTVFKRNAGALTEIFGEYSNIARNFRIGHPDLQSKFMNSLAELYRKIKGEPKMLELKEITSMEVMVRDMEHTGLQLSWLKDMLTKVRERLLENEEKRKRLREWKDKIEARKKKAKQEIEEVEQEEKRIDLELAELEKKP